MSTFRTTRRDFLKTTAAAGAAAALTADFTIAGTKSSGKVIGANSVIRIGVAGIHGRGGSHISAYSSMKDVQITYLIDPDTALFTKHAEGIKKRCGNTPKGVADIRKALADKELDAISIASCNHWHALLGIWSCQAGKDVYVEKPCSHNVFEGRKLVEAARKYKCIVQHGTQQRSSSARAKEMAEIYAGKYGKLLVSKGYASKTRNSIGFAEPGEPPAALNFDLWQGPAPSQSYHKNLVHYNWHWFWDFGNGEIGNQGVHQMDVARWGIKGGTLPKSVWSLGGRFGYKDQGQTPNMQIAMMDFGDVQLVFETFGLVGKHGVPSKVMNEFYTTEGVVVGGKFTPKSGGKALDIKVEPLPRTAGNEFSSFIASMRHRKPELCNADILEGHYSSALCHLSNISYRLGKPASFSQKPAVLGDNPQVNKSWDDMLDILKKYGVDLNKETYQLGPVLQFDAKTEKFIDNAEADKLLTRPYREPYVVPEQV